MNRNNYIKTMVQKLKNPEDYSKWIQRIKKKGEQ